jgi:hypothetical protein
MVCGVPPLVLVDGKGDLIGPFTRPKGVKSLADGHCQGRGIPPLSLRGAKRRSNPASWIATPSFVGLAMTEESVKYADSEVPAECFIGRPGQRLDGIVEIAEEFCQATRPPQSCLRGAGEL